MATAPPGYEFVKNPATGKYRLVKIGGVNPLTGGPNDPNSSLPPMGAINPLTGGPSDPNSSRPPIDAPVKPKPTSKPKPGFRWVQSHGSWVQIPVSKPKPRPKPKPVGGGATTGGATTAPAAAPLGFVDAEIQRQIAQDAGLTQFVDTQTASIADLMSSQSAQAAAIAAQYNPTTPYANATLDANAQQRVSADAALTNQIGNDQSKALAALIAKQGGAGTELMGNMRAAAQTQHRDFARHVQGLKPELERRRAEELLQQRLAVSQDRREQAMLKAQLAQMRMASELARDQFGADISQQALDNAYRDDALAASSDAAAAEAAGKDPKKGIYGFGADKDELLSGILFDWKAGQKPTVDKEGNVIPAAVKLPWRDLWSTLTSLGGLSNDQAALLATKSSPDSIRNAKKGAPGVLAMLRGKKVSPRVQAFIIKTYFGPETWASLSSNLRPAGAQSGTYQPQPAKPSRPKPNAQAPAKPRPPKPSKPPRGATANSGKWAWVGGGWKWVAQQGFFS